MRVTLLAVAALALVAQAAAYTEPRYLAKGAPCPADKWCCPSVLRENTLFLSPHPRPVCCRNAALHKVGKPSDKKNIGYDTSCAKGDQCRVQFVDGKAKHFCVSPEHGQDNTLAPDGHLDHALEHLYNA